MSFKQIVLHIPHSSDRLPADCHWSVDVRKVFARWTDWHTDTLFASSREDVGQGIAYRTIDGCTRELTEA